ncbi:MAG: PepSY domain-containing protein [Gammaproteobacteria bacterium]
MADNNSRPAPAQRCLSRVHRWLGLGSVGFVVLLSVTGIALNHAGELSLDRHYLQSPWLLEWYGIEVPPPQASFTAAAHRISLIGERLYYDNNELTDGISKLVGAVSTPSFIAIATPTDVLLVTPDGTLVERIDTEAFLPGDVTAIGVAGAVLLLRGGDYLYETDENLLTFSPCLEFDFADIQWPVPSAIPQDQLAILQGLYRGRGLSLERVILDLHSGKILTRVGPILMDAVGIILIALSVIGLFMWAGRNGKQRPSS